MNHRAECKTYNCQALGMVPLGGAEQLGRGLRKGLGCCYATVSPLGDPSRVQLVTIQWTAACQASLSLNISQSLPKFISIESAVPSNHLILCCPLLLLPSIFPNIRVFSNKSAVHIRWPNYWSFSFSISPSNEYSGLISFGIDWFDLLTV